MTTLEQQADSVIRPFTVQIRDEALDDLRRRLATTRWPSRELVGDRSQGVQLATMQALGQYWATEYDGRRVESRLNALPQFTTEIDGVDIHFVHVKSEHRDALPLIMTHGWPGSVIEMLDSVGPLTDPTGRENGGKSRPGTGRWPPRGRAPWRPRSRTARSSRAPPRGSRGGGRLAGPGLPWARRRSCHAGSLRLQSVRTACQSSGGRTASRPDDANSAILAMSLLTLAGCSRAAPAHVKCAGASRLPGPGRHPARPQRCLPAVGEGFPRRDRGAHEDLDWLLSVDADGLTSPLGPRRRRSATATGCTSRRSTCSRSCTRARWRTSGSTRWWPARCRSPATPAGCRWWSPTGRTSSRRAGSGVPAWTATSPTG